jgi:hypothetical protein
MKIFASNTVSASGSYVCTIWLALNRPGRIQILVRGWQRLDCG